MIRPGDMVSIDDLIDDRHVPGLTVSQYSDVGMMFPIAPLTIPHVGLVLAALRLGHHDIVMVLSTVGLGWVYVHHLVEVARG